MIKYSKLNTRFQYTICTIFKVKIGKVKLLLMDKK